MNTEARLKDLISEYTGDFTEKISLDDTLEELGLDSLDQVELCMAAETEFNLSIPDEEMENFITVRSIVEYLDKHSNS
jgi:acyl carrier protein